MQVAVAKGGKNQKKSYVPALIST
ncbi:uncharacterized protein METZ01_LOCUS22481 [marine metagenome]|uniref:Uncharacterized protein n=1 Tax=marine metagenome TaxID=408172 RepID=A0A381PU98_9ZZZZ